MTRSYRRSNTDIKLNSAHLPATALAWKAPELLIVLACIGAVMVSVPVALFMASPELKKAPVFSRATRDAQDFYRRCYAKNRLHRPNVSPNQIRVFCTQHMELYRQENPD